jgi:dTDP-4-dehydrorhamnose reductase
LSFLKKKIYIAGGGGMLGEAFWQEFKNDFDLKVTDIDVNELWISKLDFRDLEAYEKDVKVSQADYLFHLGAHTDLEYCECFRDDAYLTNTTAVENAVIIANRLNIPLLYISSAGIFDGRQEFYDDWDTPHPVNSYGRSKYMGERFVVEQCRKYLVCRAGWMMGGGPKKDKKFIQKILSQIKAGHKELSIVNDKFGTPTYTHDFAKNVRLLLEKECWGVYNLVCEGSTSRVEIAKEVLRIIGKEKDIAINEVPSDFFEQEYYAKRPLSECLVNSKLRLRKWSTMRNWQICLQEYLDNYYKGYLMEGSLTTKIENS